MGLGGDIVSSSFERVLVDVRLSGRKKCGLVFFYFFNGADVDRGGGRKGGRAADPPCVG